MSAKVASSQLGLAYRLVDDVSDAQVETQEVPDEYKRRWNSDRAALGKMRQRRFLCTTVILSPDWYMVSAPTIITSMIVFANVATTWPTTHVIELVLCSVLLTTAALSALLLISRDPGIYPRLRPEEKDPLSEQTSLVYCRVCDVRRPPRTSHCYMCNVCVLEHDHHCGILGGCVGMRSLRWFTLYLICTTLATLMGLLWTIRFLMQGVFNPSRMVQPLTTPVGPEILTDSVTRRRHAAPRNDVDVGVADIGAVLVLIVDTVVLLMLGSFSCIYIWLCLSATTRRESKKHGFSVGTFGRFSALWRNLCHTAAPPGSQLLVPAGECAVPIDAV